MEEELAEEMRALGFGPEYFCRLKLVQTFFSEKRPLIITVCGTPCVGKSTLAQKLAERFNLPYVIPTDLLYKVLSVKCCLALSVF